jgi:glycosyltransferase involved in cell wall biosynthesis
VTAPAPQIYWLTEEFFPPQIGGVELMVSYLSQGLAARGLAVRVITRQTEPPSSPAEALGAVDVRRIAPSGQIKGAGWRAVARMLGYLTRLARLLLRERHHYDLVIVSGMKIIPLAAVPVCRLLGKRCLIRVESTFELHEPLSAQSRGDMRLLGGWLQRSLARLQRAALARADRVIAISPEVEQLLQTTAVTPARIVTIPNAVDASRFSPATPAQRRALRTKLGLPEDRTLLLYIGRLSRAKGVDMLVRAAPRLLAHDPKLCLVIVGTGRGSFDDCESELIAFVREQRLGDDVLLKGATDRVPDYLQAADLCIFPSEYEGFGVGLIEALATGTPVISTPVGIARELVMNGETGFTFPPRDENAMITAVETALAARSRWEEIGRRAREAIQPYELESVVTRYERLCRELSAGGSVRQPASRSRPQITGRR